LRKTTTKTIRLSLTLDFDVREVRGERRKDEEQGENWENQTNFFRLLPKLRRSKTLTALLFSDSPDSAAASCPPPSPSPART